MAPSLFDACLLAGTTFLAGTIDAIAGGGGLITVPMLLAVHLPPQLALGTNKGQSAFGSGAALVRYWKSGLVDRKRALAAFALAFTGSLGGATLLMSLSPAVLRPLVLGLLVGAAAFVAFRKPPKSSQRRPNTRARLLVTLGTTLAIGAYDGFFGPGTGTFLIVLFVAVLGETMQRASANAKVANFGSNLAALLLFGSRGVIIWPYALPMALAQLGGGSLGAHLGVKVGDKLVRTGVFVVSVALVGKLAIDLVGAR